MQLQSDRTCDQSKNNSHEDLEELKKNITLTNLQLHEMMSNLDKFSQRIKQLNRKSIIQIKQELYQQAIVYLSEAQKNLEYAASCGLSLDRSLIISTLKNEACAYQRLWDLAVCYDYMQALIYNMSICPERSKDIFAIEQEKILDSEESKRVNKIFNHSLQMALNYLQFSALSSQIGKHKQAKQYSQKSLENFKKLIQICMLYEKKLNNKNSVLLEKLNESVNFKGEMNFNKMFNQCQATIQKVRNNRYFFTFNTNLIEKLTMGDIMQINPVDPQQAKTDFENEWFISQLGLTYISIYVSCCFFAIATEIRLSSQKDFCVDQKNKQSQIQKAKIYHLHSIKLASDISLIQSNFLNHIIKSLKNNFTIDIFDKKNNINEYQLAQISQIKFRSNRNTNNQRLQQQQNIKNVEGQQIIQQNLRQDRQTSTTRNHHHSKKNLTHKLPRKLSQANLIRSPSNKIEKRKSFKQKTQVSEKKLINKNGTNEKIKSKSKLKTKGLEELKKKQNNANEDYFGIAKDKRFQRHTQNVKMRSPKTKFSASKQNPRKQSSSRGKLKFNTIKTNAKNIN